MCCSLTGMKLFGHTLTKLLFLYIVLGVDDCDKCFLLLSKCFFFLKKGSFMNEWTKIDQLNTRQKLNTQLHQPKLLDPTAISSCNTKIWNGMESNIVLLFKFGKNWWPSLLISSFLIIFLFLSYPLCKSSLFNISF